ncbi:DHYS synthase, partial [Locustella ochotensis]|nr:DHYS synthase [Locustella ochotensis]
MIARLGKEINNPESICYWAQKVLGALGGLWGCHRGCHRLSPCSPQNNIPVLSPALTDGSLGDMIFFHSYKRPGLVLDIVEGECPPGDPSGCPTGFGAPQGCPDSPVPADLRLINTQAIFAARTGMIILGGGLVKHHIANANLMRNGADFSVYVNTAQEFDGSDSGARPDEAVSWGKIRVDATPVKVYADASLVFPLLVAETFARSVDAFPVPVGTPEA